MLTIKPVTTALSDILSQFFGQTETETASSVPSQVETAVDAALARFTVDQAEWVTSLFDAHFLHGRGAPVVADYLAGTQTRQQAAAELARLWELQLGPAKAPVRKQRLADAALAADSFLTYLPAGSQDHATSPLRPAVTTTEKAATVTLSGVLDSHTYGLLPAEVQTLLDTDVDRIAIDLNGLSGLELCGIYALHATAALVRGDEPPEPEQGLPGLRRLAERNFVCGRSERLTVTCADQIIRNKLQQAGLDHIYLLDA